MYSVVLLAAMTAGGQTADHHGCLSSGNCYGSCYGNYGIDAWNGYGSRSGGCYTGGYGSSWGGYSGCGCGWDYSTSGCHGCWGSYSEVSPYFVESPPAYAPTGPTAPVTRPGEAIPPPSKAGDGKPPEVLAPTRARLIVDVPADAKLTIDDTAMKTTSEHRAYQTPDLEPGQTYYYEVRVEARRDGKLVSETKRVLLHAGQEVHADFTDLTTTSTAQAK